MITNNIHVFSLLEASNATGYSAIASDGRYLYIHGDKGLRKIGSGYSGTIRVSSSDVSASIKGMINFLNIATNHSYCGGIISVFELLLMS